MTPERTERDDDSRDSPRFGRLVLVCLASVLFCGVLVWFMTSHLQDCCSTEFLDRLFDLGHYFACCSVNITEVYAGLRAGEEAKTAVFLNSLECLPVTPERARQAGLLRRDTSQCPSFDSSPCPSAQNSGEFLGDTSEANRTAW